jgi:serine/threonine protein kinase
LKWFAQLALYEVGPRVGKKKKKKKKKKHEIFHCMTPSSVSLQQKKYSEKTDSWSFGVLMYEILTRSEPYGAELSPVQAASLLVTDQISLLHTLPTYHAPIIIQVVQACLQRNPEDRPSFTQIFEMANAEY